MNEQLTHSMFYSVLFPDDSMDDSLDNSLSLQKVLRFKPPEHADMSKTSLIIFDFETTGLDAATDKIIEIGGIKVVGGKILDEFSTLVKPDIALPVESAKITGITEAMLAGQPSIQEALPKFIEFIKGSILVAHNAEFDMAFLKNEASRLGYSIEWPSFCTLKLSRTLLPELESRNLDALAHHYGFSFEARHRSIGDCKVTSAVLSSLLQNEGAHLKLWQDFKPYMAGEKR